MSKGSHPGTPVYLNNLKGIKAKYLKLYSWCLRNKITFESVIYKFDHSYKI